MRSAIAKRSVVLRGHKTSVSLENDFWNGLRDIAERQKTTLSALVQKIDADREYANLSSAIRIHVFDFYRRQSGGDLSMAQASGVAGQRASKSVG